MYLTTCSISKNQRNCLLLSLKAKHIWNWVQRFEKINRPFELAHSTHCNKVEARQAFLNFNDTIS
jgi:hypothetical protein